MPDQNKDQSDLSGDLARFIPGQAPMAGLETGNVDEVEGLIQGVDQKDEKNP